MSTVSEFPQIPLGLYIHFPWCVEKCPYCDFNAHAVKQTMPEMVYTDALIAQFGQLKAAYSGRTIETIFMGGGTPSLIHPQHVQRLLDHIREQSNIAINCEITLEANPGTVDENHFTGYLQAGVNRLSIGVQSFNNQLLKALGRIHDVDTAKRAIALAHEVGFKRINVDLMYGLPKQTIPMAMVDLSQAIETGVEHISWYQLTIEPNTKFAVSAPPLPDSERCWDMHLALMPLLQDAGFDRYEVSAFTKANQHCRHNLNYWNFGDYLAIGAGGHAKISQSNSDGLTVQRYWNKRHPQAYIDAVSEGSFIGGNNFVPKEDRVFEFLMNALRLKRGFTCAAFERSTGLNRKALMDGVSPFLQKAWLETNADTICPTAEGYRYLDEMLVAVLPEH